MPAASPPRTPPKSIPESRQMILATFSMVGPVGVGIWILIKLVVTKMIAAISPTTTRSLTENFLDEVDMDEKLPF